MKIMKQDDKIKRIKELKELIEKYNYHYYVLNESLISDYEYDLLLKELEKLENELNIEDKESPTQKVGSDLSNKFAPVEHKYPMLSLQNTYGYDEILDFDVKVKKGLGLQNNEDVEYVCEHKFDGLSISLIYIDGKLTRAVTRGDGKIGEDVTENVLTIKGIPHNISSENIRNFEVRGEIYINFKDFNKLNEERINSGLPQFANPRNFVSGTIKTLDVNVVKQRPIRISPYYLITDEKELKYHYDNLLLLKELNFPVNENIKLCKNINEVIEYCQYWEDKKNQLPYPIDGVVIKVNNLEFQKKLGSIHKFPKWAVAFKYKPDQAITKLVSVSWQVGRTGAITPVANLEPVELSGSTISRATLHNYDFIKSLTIKIGDEVVIEKGGEVIPKIVKVHKSFDDLFSNVIEHPSECPRCGSKLFKPENEVSYYCLNEECPDILLGKLIHFASKNAMDISGLGEANINLFFNLGFIKHIEDIYNLPNLRNKIVNLNRFGEKSFNNLVKSIENSKEKPFYKVLYALGIRYVGEAVAKTLVDNFKNIDNLINATEEQLASINEIGNVISKYVKNYFSNEKNKQRINKLKEIGLKFSIDEEATFKTNKLDNKTFVVTGTLKNFTREGIKNKILENGGKVSESVSRKTDYVLVGEQPGSKYNKALEFGIKIISEEEFIKMVE
ncbi:MAG TPA: NAD-dependent DNA ligase LigA [Ignavibacteriales bacterium]|nr:NAD-dependent DNA ligase LigA [Ignavibacteriales bacterium]